MKAKQIWYWCASGECYGTIHVSKCLIIPNEKNRILKMFSNYILSCVKPQLFKDKSHSGCGIVIKIKMNDKNIKLWASTFRNFMLKNIALKIDWTKLSDCLVIGCHYDINYSKASLVRCASGEWYRFFNFFKYGS